MAIIWPRITCVNEMNFCMNHAPGAVMIPRLVNLQSSVLLLCYGCPLQVGNNVALIGWLTVICCLIAWLVGWLLGWVLGDWVTAPVVGWLHGWLVWLIASWMVCWLRHWLVICLMAGRLVFHRVEKFWLFSANGDWLADCLVDWLADWLVDWLVTQLI